MAINKYTIRRFGALTLATLSVAVLVFLLMQCAQYRTANEPKVFDQKVQIVDEVKLQIQPTYYSEKGIVDFYIELESFQHPELIGMDPVSTILLVGDDGTYYVPTKWSSRVNEDFNVKGTLRFETIPNDLSQLVLKFFVLDELEMTWPL